MKKIKLVIIILCSFLLGGLSVFAISRYQMFRIVSQDNIRLANEVALENVDWQLISLLRDSFGKVFICLELGGECHTQNVLSEIQKESIQVRSLNEQRQNLIDKK